MRTTSAMTTRSVPRPKIRRGDAGSARRAAESFDVIPLRPIKDQDCNAARSVALRPLDPAKLPGLPLRGRLGDAAPLLQRVIVAAVPPVGHRRQPPLLAGSLETKPAGSELGCHRRARVALAQPALLAGAPLAGVNAVLVDDTALTEAALGRRG